MPILQALPGQIKSFAPGEVKASMAIVRDWEELFLHPRALFANLLDPRYKGQKLSPQQKVVALNAAAELATKLRLDLPLSHRIIACIAGEGPYKDAALLACLPYHFWTVLFKGDPLTDFASTLVSLPCSQAGVERVFSAADFAAENRERLGFDHLADEVFVRYNTNKLAVF